MIHSKLSASERGPSRLRWMPSFSETSASEDLEVGGGRGSAGVSFTSKKAATQADGNFEKRRSSGDSRRKLRAVFIKLFVDLRRKASSENLRQIEFFNAVCFNPLHLFEFADSRLERKYEDSRTTQNTHHRIVYISLLYCLLLPPWLLMWFTLRDFWRVHPELYPVALLHLYLGGVVLTVTILCALYVCFVRRYVALRDASQGSLKSSEGTSFGLPAAGDLHSSMGAAASSAQQEEAPSTSLTSYAYNKGLTKILEVQPDTEEKGLQERLKLGGFRSTTLERLKTIARTTPLKPKKARPWWVPPEAFVRFCCGETPLILLFIILSASTCASHLASLWFIENGYIHTRDVLRLLRLIVALYALAANWFILCAFLTSKSLFISPRKCFFLWLFQLGLLCLPPAAGRKMFGLTYWEEMLALTLALSTTIWAFFTKTKVDLSSRMFFYIIWRQTSNKVERRPGSSTNTRTGMEDVLVLLSEIGQLITLATAAGSGSIRHTTLTMKTLSRVSECQRLLTRYQDLFKVRVTGNATRVPLDYAIIYGIELGQKRGGDLETGESNAGYFARRSLASRPNDTILNSLATGGDRHLKDVSGIKEHLLEMSYRRSVRESEGDFTRRFNANEVVANLNRKLSRSFLSKANSKTPTVRRITWGPKASGHSSGDLALEKNGRGDSRSRRRCTQPVVSDSSAKSRRRRRKAASNTRRSDHTIQRNWELGGLLPEEIPKRKLTESLAGIVGDVWTIDLFDLDAKCGGNILVEVGYALIGRRLGNIIRDNPGLIDATLLHNFARSEKSRKRSNLFVFDHQPPAHPVTETTTQASEISLTAHSAEPRDVQLSVLHLYVLMSFLYCLQEQYRPLPYHNSVHGAHVAHSTACIVNYLHLSAGPAFTPAAELAYILACLGHDVGHPGRNNQFFINSYDPLSVIYNDVAVLENFHSCLLFMTLELENCNVLFPFTVEVFREVRELIIKLILATDMKNHFQQLSRFKVRRSDPSFCPYTNSDDLKLLLEICIKVGDLSASACSWIVHKDWCFRVVEEFYQQGAEEQELGLPISPLCDRLKHAQEFAKSQAGFIEFVTAPLFSELRAFDEDEKQIHQLTFVLAANKAKWDALAVDPSLECLQVPVHIQEYGNVQNAILPPAHKTSGSETTNRKNRDGYKRRRWRSIVGPISAQPPMPIVESRNRRSKAKKANDDFETLSLGDLMSSSSWGDEEDNSSGNLTAHISGKMERSGSTVQFQKCESNSSAFDDSTISLGSSSSAGSSNGWLGSSSDEEDEVSSLFNPPHKKMRRDLALSPSARVAPVEIPNNSSVLDIIKRRASVLTPIE